MMPRLGEAFHAARERAGLSLLDLYVHGREHEQLYQLAEALMELDEWMQTWRIRHYRVVARVIGERVVGTQGTPVEVLGRLIHKVEFPELWDVRNELTARSQAEAVTPPRGGRPGSCRSCSASNTVNPPGNETAAAELLRDYLARSGIPCELVGALTRAPEPRRPAAGRRRPVAGVARPHGHRSRGRRRSGRAIRGRAISSTARSGAAAHST